MVSRRLIRIKTFQIVFSQYANNELDFNIAYKNLKQSISKTQDLYFSMLNLLVSIKNLAEEKIEINKRKRLPTETDLNPQMNFVRNKMFDKIENNLQYQRFMKDDSLNWRNKPEFVEKLYKQLIEQKEYKIYQYTQNPNLKADKKIIYYILETIIGNSDEIVSILEEEHIYWTEDFEFVINNVLKTIRIWKDNMPEDEIISTLYKNDDDKQFAFDLLKAVLENHDKHLELIDKHTQNWEVERIIQIDIILMEMALAELINMPSIPVKVSLDEYIELSKYYSSSKSKVFINGVLDKLIEELKESGEIQKKGRGLIGQV